jgi:Carboxypeptidase regulatory-like domain
MKRLLSFVVVAALFAACSPSPIRPTPGSRNPAPPDQPANTFGLSGSVSESTSDGMRPVDGATIGIGDEFGNFVSTSSAVDGRYEVHGLSAGTWELSVSKDGYETMTMAVQVSGEMALDIELRTSSNQF